MHLVHSNPIKKEAFRQVFSLFKHVSMNAVNTFGKDIFNVMFPEYTRRILNGQLYHF